MKDARRLSDELRYEESIVEYQRYLAGNPNRPVAERARALLELGFLHLLLDDPVSAERRTTEALELQADIQLPANAPAKQQAFLDSVRSLLAARTVLEVLPRAEEDAPGDVRVRLTDPSRHAQRVLLRHALSPRGPFYASPMRCEEALCRGSIPPPSGAASFTAWYFVEALDAEGATRAQAASPTEPLQLAVVGQGGWYQSPWVWGAGGAALVAVAGVVFLLSPAPPR